MNETVSNHPLNICCLVVLVGAPGAGKSTWAANNGKGAVHVSQDGLIDAITPLGFEHVYRGVYSQAEEAIARAALQAGHTVIVDRTNRTRAHRKRWLNIARDAACPAVALVFTTHRDLCNIRNSQRIGARRLSEDRMRRMLEAFEPVSSEEGFYSIHSDSGTGEGIRLRDILPKTGSEQQVYEHYNQAR